MRTISVIKSLRSQGHHVGYVTRADGGVRIYSVDGIKFSKSNSDGNNFAREFAGLNLTSKQYSQRRESGEVALKLSKARKIERLPSLSVRKADKAFKRKQKAEVRRLMQKLNKQRVSQGEKPFDPIKLRQRIRRQGYGETAKTIKNILLKTAGIAYPRAVESFIEYLDDLTRKYDSADLNALVARTKHALNRTTLIMDKTLKHLYEEFYDVEKALRENLKGARTQGVFIGIGDSVEREIEKSFAEAMSLADF
nr:MAG TPA: hypothetical protein [Caudoviricetes sp.]